MYLQFKCIDKGMLESSYGIWLYNLQLRCIANSKYLRIVHLLIKGSVLYPFQVVLYHSALQWSGLAQLTIQKKNPTDLQKTAYLAPGSHPPTKMMKN